MKHKSRTLVTIAEVFEMATRREPKLARLARKTGISRATLYRIRDGAEDIEFATYGKLARFVQEAV